MKKTIISIVAFLFVSILFSQNFTQVTGYGFGTGLEYPAPTFADLDGDSMLEMLIGDRYCRIGLYEEVGNSCYEFDTIDFDFMVYDDEDEICPFLFDIDNDGLFDLLVGVNSGIIHHYEQVDGDPYNFELVNNSFVGDCGQNAKPTIVDIDNDGLLDLLVGVREGNIKHFEQDSVGSYQFDLINEEFSDILIGMWIPLEPGEFEWWGGSASPTLSDVDQDGFLEMFVGTDYQGLHYYEQSEINSEIFNLIDDNYLGVIARNPRFYDIDNDGLMDYLASDRAEITHFEQENSNSIDFLFVGTHLYGVDAGRFSRPCSFDIDNDGRIDILIGSGDGKLEHHIQDTANGLQFSMETEYFNNIQHGGDTHPSLCDIDNDNLLDLLIQYRIGNTGYIAHYEQNEINSFTFLQSSETFSALEGYEKECISLYDIDADGLLDILIGSHNGTLNHYEQVLLNSYNFELIEENFNEIEVSFKSAPLLCDIENDGLVDLLVGNQWGKIFHYKQSEMGSYDFEFQTANFEDITLTGCAVPAFTDIDNDGNMDLFVGSLDGGLDCFTESITNVEDGEISVAPGFILSNYPNPFNPSTAINFSIQNDSEIDLSIYNIKGQKIKTLVQNEYTKGNHSVVWNGDDEDSKPVSSGIYYYKLNVNGKTEAVKKCLLLK